MIGENVTALNEILEIYADDLSVAECSFEMMGRLLDTEYLKQRIDELRLKELYIYGGGYLGIQLYYACNNLVRVPAVVDKKGHLQLAIKHIPVIGADRLKEVYKGEKIVIASIRYYQEIRQELLSFISGNNIIFLGELLGGVLS